VPILDGANKRKIKEVNEFELEKCFPLFFWKTCQICGMEFVRERMFFISVMYHPLAVFNMYFCNECSKHKEKVQDVIKQKRFNASKRF